MRGVAALIVCLGHCASHILWPAGSEVGRIVRGVTSRLLDGGAAVDFFFVLSGFVLALPHVSRKSKPLLPDDFLLRRVVRIMPTYWAGLAIALLLRATFGSHWSLLGHGDHGGWAAPLTSSDLIRHVLLIFKFDIEKINGVIWSLAVEMQISILLPLVIAVFMQRPTLRGSLATLGICTVIPYVVGSGSGIVFLPLFVLGCLLAYYQTPLDQALANLGRLARGGLWLCAAALFWNRSLQHWWAFPDMQQEYLTGLGSGLAILLITSLPEPPRVLGLRPVRFLGDISYSFYLLHSPILLATIIGLRMASFSDWVAIPTGFVLSVVGSAALYYAMERPSIQWGRRLSAWLASRDPARATSKRSHTP
jgi:peptidoglycan/LPS O-acetylase OafA/YrhL